MLIAQFGSNPGPLDAAVHPILNFEIHMFKLHVNHKSHVYRLYISNVVGGISYSCVSDAGSNYRPHEQEKYLRESQIDFQRHNKGTVYKHYKMCKLNIFNNAIW